MTWTAEAVLREAQEWVWAPPGTPHIRTDWCHALLPDGLLTVAWVDLDTSPAEAGERLRRLAADHDRTELVVTVSDTTRPPGLEEWLIDHGSIRGDVTEVMGWDLTTGDLPAGPDDPDGALTVDLVETVEDWLGFQAASREVWGGDPPTEQEIIDQAAELAVPIAERGGFTVLIRYNGEPATTAGVTLAGPVARLWGAGTRPGLRGHGAYRASVRGRLAIAREHGATLGLTNALVGTSAPILERLGFKRYGAAADYRWSLS